MIPFRACPSVRFYNILSNNSLASPVVIPFRIILTLSVYLLSLVLLILSLSVNPFFPNVTFNSRFMSNHSLSVYSFKRHCLTDEVSIESICKQNRLKTVTKIQSLFLNFIIVIIFHVVSLFLDFFYDVLYSIAVITVRYIAQVISIMGMVIID